MICHLHYSELPCAQCAVRKELIRADGLPAPAVITFKEHTNENMFHPWEKPYAVSSQHHLAQECRDRGLTSEYLRDSSIWRTREPKWF